ncbi:nascent polypeptide-associated complex subunit alpha, muscle-specific form-like [Thrips palmi]|uniref:Nascent polypeptide-associated complex subunit alpha, muscle-specific form-like n=1 Tax=Thrips palmi TaxID=161013 RepID=A0A6P8ZW99_THRPL|nr:nascent polypeptide-associated complex subunit alpha, muscle-specific form-like [Thrips palmi]
MDPSLFFGRTRATRQTLKSKQETTIKESENCEVNEDVPKEINKLPAKGRKAKLVTGGKENDAVKEATTKRASKRTQQSVNENKEKDELNAVKVKRKPASKSLKVHFDGDSQESPSSGEKRPDAAPSGPVYQNVRRSDVIGDPYNEYDFPLGSDSSPEKTKKKKKKTITSRTKPVKKAGGVVKWDPSKRPIVVKPKPAKKLAVQAEDLTVTNTTKTAKTKLNSIENPVKAAPLSKAIPPVKVTHPVEANSQVKATPVEANSVKTIPSVRANPPLHSAVTPELNKARHFTSTPVLRHPSSKNVPNTAAPSSTGKSLTQSLPAIPSAKGQALSVPSCSLSSTHNESFEPSSPSIMADIPCASTPTNDALNQISLNAQSSSKSQSARLASRSSYLLQLPVRESPSFGEVLNSPRMPSPGLIETECARNLDAVTSTPVTRSRRTNGEAGSLDKPSVSKSKRTCPAVTISDRSEKLLSPRVNDSDGNLSGIFDDIPRTSVLPTRMFSTHRGTIYIPEGQNVPKRNIPELSPSKEQTSSRATVVKFSDPTSSGLEQCFGFDNEDVTFVPQPTNIVKKPTIKKPNISIPDALAILRGQCKLASPANNTPRSIQTKLTDFVCSTPTSSTARVVAVSNQPVLTPTPVPLFDEDQIDADLRSPFSQPSRRSYDRFRPVKRIACGDEVHSGDEEEQIDESAEPTIPVKKKSKSYKRTKKPKETQLDAWANQLASHFDEVEQVELQLE